MELGEGEPICRWGQERGKAGKVYRLLWIRKREGQKDDSGLGCSVGGGFSGVYVRVTQQEEH